MNQQQIIERLSRLRRIGQTPTNQVNTFSRFNMDEDVATQQVETVTGGIWTGNQATLTTFFTSSTMSDSQRRYYVDVQQSNPSTTGSAVQFSIAYGNRLGSGSYAQGDLNDSPTRAVYSQYRQLLLTANDTQFTMVGSGSTDSIYVINFKRERLKSKLSPGLWELPLTSISTRAVNATGSITVGSTTYTLIDDSSLSSGSINEYGRVFNIVSGSKTNGVYNSTSPVYYGLVYPDYGVMILDGRELDNRLAFKTNLSSSSATTGEGNNHFALFHSISGSGALGKSFQARNSEKVSSTHYFVRVKNGQYNFSNNPSYTSGSDGTLLSAFVSDPKTYITTIGLYNDRQELLAVAKLSKPVLKSFQRESLIRVKLDF